MTLEAGKEIDRKYVFDWLNKVYISPSVSYSQYTDDEIRMLAHDTLVLLKEQGEKTGEWIYKHDNLWYCSRCGEMIYSSTDDDLEIHHAYCSRCGAKMK